MQSLNLWFLFEITETKFEYVNSVLLSDPRGMCAPPKSFTVLLL